MSLKNSVRAFSVMMIFAPLMASAQAIKTLNPDDIFVDAYGHPLKQFTCTTTSTPSVANQYFSKSSTSTRTITALNLVEARIKNLESYGVERVSPKHRSRLSEEVKLTSSALVVFQANALGTPQGSFITEMQCSPIKN